MSSTLDQVQNVDIDSKGRFKYILVKIKDGSHHKYIVRGHGRAGFHGMCLLESARLLLLKYNFWASHSIEIMLKDVQL
jgi:hypothetical protein